MKDWLVQPYRTERDHLNIEKLTALFVVMPIHYLIYGYKKCDSNILKMHMCANIKKDQPKYTEHITFVTTLYFISTWKKVYTKY